MKTVLRSNRRTEVPNGSHRTVMKRNKRTELNRSQTFGAYGFFRILEDGDFRLLEDGDFRLLE